MTSSPLPLILLSVGQLVGCLEDIVGARFLSAVALRSRATFLRTGSVGMILALCAALLAPLVACSAAAMIALSVCVTGVAAVRIVVLRSLDGAESMAVCCGVLLVGFGATEAVDMEFLASAWQVATVLFVGLAYLDSGVGKLRERQWRAGAALGRIFADPQYNASLLLRAFRALPGLSLVASWAIIALEVAALPAFIVGGAVTLATVLLLLGMHVTIAVVMGLPRFLWSFAAALCMVLIAHGLL